MARPDDRDPVVVDCDSCLVRSAAACGDCVVTVLLGSPPAGIELRSDEQAALDALADSGLVPPLRLVTGRAARRTEQAPKLDRQGRGA